MKDYYQKSIRALQLAGMGESTQEGYTRSVRQLVDFSQKTPDKISEQELEDYFLHKKNEEKWKPSTLKVSYCGIKFLFTNVLQREWHLFEYLNAKAEYQLPFFLQKRAPRMHLKSSRKQ